MAGLIRPKMPFCLSIPLTAQPAIQPLTFLFWPIWQRKTKWKQYSIAGWTLSSKTLVYISQDTYSRKCRSQRVHAVVVLDLPRAGVRWLAKWEVREWSLSRQWGTGHWPAGYPTITKKAPMSRHENGLPAQDARLLLTVLGLMSMHSVFAELRGEGQAWQGMIIFYIW